LDEGVVGGADSDFPVYTNIDESIVVDDSFGG
jgi:hypothetical protein